MAVEYSSIMLKRHTDADAECTEDERIGATEYAERNGTRTEKRRRCGTYNAGVKDLASAYVLCPRLAEMWGSFNLRTERGLRNNEGIVSGVVTPVWKTDKD